MVAATRTLQAGAVLVADGSGSGGGTGAVPGTRVWSPSSNIIVELEGDKIEEIVKSSISLIVGSRFGLDDSRFGRDISGFGRFAGDRCASTFPSSIVTCLSSNSTFFGPEIDANLLPKKLVIAKITPHLFIAVGWQ